MEEGVESKRRKVDSVGGDAVNAESLAFGVTSHDFDLDRPLLDHFRVEDFFVGRSDLNEMTLRSSGFGPAFDGNTSLWARKCSASQPGQRLCPLLLL